MLNSLDSFVPSALDPILKKPSFPSLLALRGIDTSSFITDTPRKRRVVPLINSLQQAECPDADVFALDNTNAIEGYFNGIKQRMQVSPLTLLDVFRAVDSTERTMLASRSPFTPNIPNSLKIVLLNILSHDVLNVVSSIGIQRLLQSIVSVSTTILTDSQTVLNEVDIHIFGAIVDGIRITYFRQMPYEWIEPSSFGRSQHSVSKIDIANPFSNFDILMRLQPFFEISHRSIPIFNALNNSLMNLYSLEERPLVRSVMPANSTFFYREFEHFTNLSQTNTEVRETLLELCNELESKNGSCETTTNAPKSLLSTLPIRGLVGA